MKYIIPNNRHLIHSGLYSIDYMPGKYKRMFLLDQFLSEKKRKLFSLICSARCDMKANRKTIELKPDWVVMKKAQREHDKQIKQFIY